MGLKIISASALCSVQSITSPITADIESIVTANRIVCNNDAEGVLEITENGIEAKFTEDCVIVMTGADMEWEINGKDIHLYKAVEIKKGDRLTCDKTKSGYRSYMAVAGGFDIFLVDESYATNLEKGTGGFCGRCITDGDIIPFRLERSQLLGKYKGVADIPDFPDDDDETEIRVTVTQGKLEQNRFTVKSDLSSRGIFFKEAETFTGNTADIKSVLPLKVGNCELEVLSSDISNLMQTPAGGKIKFKEVSKKEAKFINFRHKLKLAWLDYRMMF